MVSIFVPYYNDCSFLRDCIDSVLNQSYENFELILLDHASTDGSAEIAHSYKDSRIKHISLVKNLGAGGGVLIGEFLNVAKGDFVKLFCADDIMHSDCITSCMKFMKKNPLIDVMFGNVGYVDAHLKTLEDNWFNNRSGFCIDDQEIDLLLKLKNGMSFLPYVGSFIRRTAFAHIKLNKTFIMVFDMSIWVEMLFDDRKIAFLDKIIASYRIHEKQVSAIKNMEIVQTRSFYESFAYCDLFYSHVKDVCLLRRIYKDSSIVSLMTHEDTDLVEFVMAHYYLRSESLPYRANAYVRLERMLSDNHMANRIEKKFFYGIKEFRSDYSVISSSPSSKSVRKNIYNKSSRDLNILEIIYLLLRRLWNTIFPLKVIKRKMQQKNNNRRFSA